MKERGKERESKNGSGRKEEKSNVKRRKEIRNV
jgi:hypothetical protein